VEILHIIVGLEIGGAELMLKRLIESSVSGGEHTHKVVSLTEVGALGLQMSAAGVQVRALGMRSAAHMPRALFALRTLIRNEKPDIVQTWMYHADLLGGLAARMAGNRNVMWGIRTTNVAASGRRVTTALMRLCALLSSSVPKVIVCAANAARDVHARNGYDDARMVVIPNGFDLSRLHATEEGRNALRAQCGFSQADLVVGIVGRFDLAKDHQNFIRAAGITAEQHNTARFLLVGRGLDASNKQLKQWISETGHADRFVLLGERTDVATCLSAMDVFCLSSRTEGFPNVVGEAMAMGLPSVVTDVGDAAFLVGSTGIVVPKENSAALAKGMGALIAMDAGERGGMGLRARERIHADFTIDRVRVRFESIYRSMSTKKGN
jgi:glycosyltransferase involved in cell wall biosynthesis